jgi:hypothetical protein
MKKILVWVGVVVFIGAVATFAVFASQMSAQIATINTSLNSIASRLDNLESKSAAAIPAVAQPTNNAQASNGTWYAYPEFGFKVQIPNGLIVQPLESSKYATTPPEDSYVMNARTPSENADYEKNQQDAFRPSLTIEVASNPSHLPALGWARAHEGDVPDNVTNVTVAGVSGISYVDSSVGLTVYIFPADTKSQTGKMASIMATNDISADQFNAIIQSITFQ